jgi:hypothetical protein
MQLSLPFAALSVKDDKIIEKGVGVILPTKDDEQITKGVHSVAMSWSGRPSFGLHLLPRKRLDVLKIYPPDIIQVLP